MRNLTHHQAWCQSNVIIIVHVLFCMFQSYHLYMYVDDILVLAISSTLLCRYTVSVYTHVLI